MLEFFTLDVNICYALVACLSMSFLTFYHTSVLNLDVVYLSIFFFMALIVCVLF